MVAVAEGLDRRFDDKIRRPEIGLADAKIDDVAALRDQGIGAGEHRERVLLADAVKGGDCTNNDCCPPQAARRTTARNASSWRRHFSRSDSKNQTAPEPCQKRRLVTIAAKPSAD